MDTDGAQISRPAPLVNWPQMDTDKTQISRPAPRGDGVYPHRELTEKIIGADIIIAYHAKEASEWLNGRRRSS